jgi:hypothetical protein
VSDLGDVAFWSNAPNLGAAQTIYVHDHSGTTARVGAFVGNQPLISADGRYVAFDSSADNGDPTDTNGRQDTFVYDRSAAVLERVSVAADGSQIAQGGGNPAMSADGRFVTFASFDNALLPPGSPTTANVFVRDRSGPADTTAPSATIRSPQDGASYSVGQVVSADYSCSDPSGIRQCTGPLPTGSAIDTATAGTHTFQVSAVDNVGNTGAQSVSYTVLAGNVSATVTNGGTITTDPGNVGATADVPVQTSITAPAGVSGTLSVTPQTTMTSAPTGFSLFGKEVVLAGPVATTSSPYQVSFTVDSTALNGIAPADVQVFRNGAALAGCTDPTAAVPDPCMASRGVAPGGGGDALVTVRTSHFSTWSLGRLKYVLTGPFQPVDAVPTLNTAKAGSAIPVKFKLGGNRGLNVLADGYPKSGTASCGSVPTDEIEQSVKSTTSALTYDPGSTQYTYTWRTATTMKGCRDLVLRFRDGSQLRILFNLR